MAAAPLPAGSAPSSSSLPDFHGSKVRAVLDRVLTLKPRHLVTVLAPAAGSVTPAAAVAAAALLAKSAGWLLPRYGRFLHVFDFGFSDGCRAQGNACPLVPAAWGGQVSRWASGDGGEAPAGGALLHAAAALLAWLRGDPHNVALLLAPSAAHLAVLLAAAAHL